MNEERCAVVYKKVHGEKVVAIAVSQRGSSETRIHTLVCRIQYEFDAIQTELNRNKRGQPIIEWIVPQSYSSTATMTLPPLPVPNAAAPNGDLFQLSIDAWVQKSGLRASEIAVAAVSQANVFPEFAQMPVLQMSELLVAETLIAGAFGAWGSPFITFANKLTRSLEERRPLVRALERLLPLVGLQNNIKVYADAFGYGVEKAHKDVRTYREAVRRLEQGNLG
jgi:hypothetical protein